MVEKKKGRINELIYNQTVYNAGKNVMFLNTMGIEFLVKKIIELTETTKYIRFNPFYRNSKLNVQIEYEDYMFYMECRDDFSENDLKEHWTKCMDNIYDIPHDVIPYDEFSDDKKKMVRILRPLCKSNDVVSYHVHLNNYKKYLYEFLPMLFEDAIKQLDLTHGDLAFGYFCFEVHSG